MSSCLKFNSFAIILWLVKWLVFFFSWFILFWSDLPFFHSLRSWDDFGFLQCGSVLLIDVKPSFSSFSAFNFLTLEELRRLEGASWTMLSFLSFCFHVWHLQVLFFRVRFGPYFLLMTFMWRFRVHIWKVPLLLRPVWVHYWQCFCRLLWFRNWFHWSFFVFS